MPLASGINPEARDSTPCDDLEFKNASRLRQRRTVRGLAGVEVELLGPRGSVATRSRASGSIHADIEPGRYEVVLAKDGYGSKRVTVDLTAGPAVSVPAAQGRPAGLCLAQVGQERREGEFRVHSDAAYKLELWRYGWQEGAGPADRLVRRARPAGDGADHARRRLHADRRDLEQVRLHAARTTSSSSTAPGAVGALLLPRQERSRAVFLVSLDRRAARAAGRRSPCWPRTSPGTPTTTSAAAATTSIPTSCRRRRPSTPAWS